MGSSRRLTWAGWLLVLITIVVMAAVTGAIGVLIVTLFDRPSPVEDSAAVLSSAVLYLVIFVVASGTAAYLVGKRVLTTLKITVVQEAKESDAEHAKTAESDRP